jgi:hypothetical protein
MYRATILKQKLRRATAITLCCCCLPSYAQAPNSAIAINELFTRVQADCPEWIEIANISSVAFNLKNWKFGDQDDTCVITSLDYIISPGRFVVLTKDKTLFSKKYPAAQAALQPLRWHALDNYHDTMYVWDGTGVVQECVGWDYRWFDGWTNQSLSRVSFVKSGMAKDAWVVAVRPSPDQPNSEVLWRAEGASVEIGPIPFTPNGDGKDDILSIRLAIPASATVALSVYGFDGRKYFDFQQPLSAQELWNGKSTGGGDMPVGPFFVVFEVSDNSSRQIIRKKGILWR